MKTKDYSLHTYKQMEKMRQFIDKQLEEIRNRKDANSLPDNTFDYQTLLHNFKHKINSIN